jgi:hypothetical protein
MTAATSRSPSTSSGSKFGSAKSLGAAPEPRAGSGGSVTPKWGVKKAEDSDTASAPRKFGSAAPSTGGASAPFGKAAASASSSPSFGFKKKEEGMAEGGSTFQKKDTPAAAPSPAPGAGGSEPAWKTKVSPVSALASGSPAAKGAAAPAPAPAKSWGAKKAETAAAAPAPAPAAASSGAKASWGKKAGGEEAGAAASSPAAGGRGGPAPAAVPVDPDTLPVPDGADPVPYAIIRADRLGRAADAVRASLEHSGTMIGASIRANASSIEQARTELVSITEAAAECTAPAKALPKDLAAKLTELQRGAEETEAELATAKMRVEVAQAEATALLPVLAAGLASVRNGLEEGGVRAASGASAPKAEARPLPLPEDREASVSAAAETALAALPAVRATLAATDAFAQQLSGTGVETQSRIVASVRKLTAAVAVLRKSVAANISSLAKDAGLGSPSKDGASAPVARLPAEEAAEALTAFARDLAAFRTTVAGIRKAAPLSPAPAEAGLDAGVEALRLHIAAAEASHSALVPSATATAALAGLSGDLALLRSSINARRAAAAVVLAQQAESAPKLTALLDAARASLAPAEHPAADGEARTGGSTSATHDSRISAIVSLQSDVDRVRSKVASVLAGEVGCPPDPEAHVIVDRTTAVARRLATAVAMLSDEGGTAATDGLWSLVDRSQERLREVESCLESSAASASKLSTDCRVTTDRMAASLAGVLIAITAAAAGNSLGAEAARKYTTTVAGVMRDFSLVRDALARSPPAVSAAEAALPRFGEGLQSIRVAVALSTAGSTSHIQAVAEVNADVHGLRQALSVARTAAASIAPRLARNLDALSELIALLRGKVTSGRGSRQHALETAGEVAARLAASSVEPVSALRLSDLSSAVSALQADVALEAATGENRAGPAPPSHAPLVALAAFVAGLSSAVEKAGGEALLAGEMSRRAVDGMARRVDTLAAALAGAPGAAPAIVMALATAAEALRSSAGGSAADDGGSGSRPAGAMGSLSRITEQLGSLRAAVDANAAPAPGGVSSAVDGIAAQVARLQEALISGGEGAVDAAAALAPGSSLSASSPSQIDAVARVGAELSDLRARLDAGKAGEEGLLRTVLVMLEEVHGLRTAVGEALGADTAQRSRIARLASELEAVRADSEGARQREEEALARAAEASLARQMSEQTSRAVTEDLLDRGFAEKRRLETEAAVARQEAASALAIAKLQKEAAEARLDASRIASQEAQASEVERVRTEGELARMRLSAELEAARKAREAGEARAASHAASLAAELHLMRSMLASSLADREEDSRRLNAALAAKDRSLELAVLQGSQRLEETSEASRRRMEMALDEASKRLQLAREDGEMRAAEVMRMSAEAQAELVRVNETRRVEMESALARARMDKEAAEDSARVVQAHLQDRLIRAHALHESATREIREAVHGFTLAAGMREQMGEYERRLVGERKRVIQLERALGLPTSSPAILLADASALPVLSLPPIPAVSSPPAASSRAFSPPQQLERQRDPTMSIRAISLAAAAAVGSMQQSHGESLDAQAYAARMRVPAASVSAAPEGVGVPEVDAVAIPSPEPAPRPTPQSLAVLVEPPSGDAVGPSLSMPLSTGQRLAPKGNVRPTAALTTQLADSAFAALGIRRPEDAIGGSALSEDAARSILAFVQASGSRTTSPPPRAAARKSRGPTAPVDHAADLSGKLTPARSTLLPSGSPRTVDEIMALARRAALESRALDPHATVLGTAVVHDAKVAAANATSHARLVEYLAARARQATHVQAGVAPGPEEALAMLRHRERVVLSESGDVAAQASALMDKLTYEAAREVNGAAAARRVAAEARLVEQAEASHTMRLRAFASPVWKEAPLAIADGARPAAPAPADLPGSPAAAPAAASSPARGGRGGATAPTASSTAQRAPPIAGKGAVFTEVLAGPSPAHAASPTRADMEAEIAELERLAAIGGKALAAAAKQL